MIDGPSQSPSDDTLSEAYRAYAHDLAGGAHPGEAEWEAFALHTLDREARTRLADHVVSCDSCREVYEAVRTLMAEAPAEAGAASAGVLPGTPDSSTRRMMPALALAASALLAVAAAIAYVTSSGPHEPTHATRDQGSTAEAPGVPASPARETYRLALVKPDVQLPVDLVVTTRGTAGVETRTFLERFGAAIASYREGRFEEAATALAALAATNGDVPEVSFYLGVSHLFAGRPAQALTAFDHPGIDAAFGDDVRWQRAVALERLGRRPESDAVLRALCARDGRYREQACTAVSQDARIPSRP